MATKHERCMERLQREQYNVKRPLLRLPTELRLAIYFYVLPTNEIVDIEDPRLWHTFNVRYGSYKDGPQLLMQGFAGPRPNGPDYRSTLAITQACRQLREEAMQHYYGSNTFLLRMTFAENGYPMTTTWLDMLAEEASHSIRWLLAVGSEACIQSGRYCDRVWRLDLRDKTVQYVNVGGRCVDCPKRQMEDLEGIRNQFLMMLNERSGDSASRKQLQQLLRIFTARHQETHSTPCGV